MIPNDFVIDKFSAARRQLIEAINIFFSAGDLVAVHTLAFAAFGIINDIAENKGIVATQISKIEADFGNKPELKKLFHDALSEAGNYLKHADRDPNAHLQFKPNLTTFILYDALRTYFELTGEKVKQFSFYRSWFEIKYKMLRQSEDPISKRIREAAEGLNPDDTLFWFEEAKKLGILR